VTFQSTKYFAFSSSSFFLAASISSGVGCLTSSFWASFFLSSFFALGSLAACLLAGLTSSFFSSCLAASSAALGST